MAALVEPKDDLALHSVVCPVGGVSDAGQRDACWPPMAWYIGAAAAGWAAINGLSWATIGLCALSMGFILSLRSYERSDA